jgi:hypothetical protein
MFFKDRHALRATYGILTSVLLFLVVFLAGPVLSVENSESAKNLVPTLLANPDVRVSLANKILDQISKDSSDKQINLIIRVGRPLLVPAISANLSSPATIVELQNDVELGYRFVTTNESITTIPIKPLFASLLAAMGKVDPLFKNSKKTLKDVKPITLTRDRNTAKIGTWLSYARAGYIALIILLAISLFFFVRFSTSGKRALRGIGKRVLAVGILSIVQFIVIAIVASAFARKATEPLVKTVVPVAARALFSYYESIGIALIIIGAVAILIARRIGFSAQKISVVTAEV